MTLKWILGSFIDGSIDESAVLPVVRGSDLANVDVNSEDSANLQISLRDLPSDWRSYLKPLDKTVTLVDVDDDWETAVLFSGFINKVEASPKETVSVQVAGLREYLTKLHITSTYKGTNTNPESGKTFQGSTYQNLIHEVIVDAFDASSITAGDPTPPQVLGTVAGTGSTTGISYEVKNNEFWSYADALDEIRDNLSSGEEYRFVPRFYDSNRNRIVWDVQIGTSAAPHISEASEVEIVLADNEWKPTKWRESRSMSQIASRILGNSKYGDGTSGGDFTGVVSTDATEILIDQTFNPGVELDSSQMAAQLASRLEYAQNPAKTADFERVFDDLDALRTELARLGSMGVFSGTGETEYFGTSMRIVRYSFSARDRKLSVTLMQKAARYPNLPKRGSLVPAIPSYTSPIIPRIPANQPVISGGGGTTTPPFTIPTFEEESPLTLVGGKYVNGASANNWRHTSPSPSSFRQRGKFVYSLSAKGCTISQTTPGATSSTPSLQDLVVRCWDLESNTNFTSSFGAEPFSNAFSYSGSDSSSTIASATLAADAYNTNDADLIISTGAGQYVDNPLFGGSNEFRSSWMRQLGVLSSVDFDLIVGDSEVFVRVLYSVSSCVWPNAASQDSTTASADKTEAKWKISEKVYKATRNSSTGAIGSFSALATNPFDNGTEIFWSPGNTWFHNGRFYCFGGYSLPKTQLDDSFEITDFLPHYANAFYSHTLYSVNEDGSSVETQENFLDLATPGPVDSENDGHLDRLHHLFSRVSGNRIIVGYSNGLTNTREYFSSSFLSLTFSKIMGTSQGPKTELSWGLAGLMESDAVPAPIIIGENVLMVELGGIFDILLPTTNGSFTGRAINTSRCKIGFSDTIFSSLPLGDVASAGRPFRYAPVSSSIISNQHFFGALFGIRGNFSMASLDSGSDCYEYQLVTGRTTNSAAGAYGSSGYFVNRSFLRQGNAVETASDSQIYAFDTTAPGGVGRDYSTRRTTSVYNPTTDWNYFYHAGKLFVFVQSAIAHYISQTISNDPSCSLLVFDVDTSSW